MGHATVWNYLLPFFHFTHWVSHITSWDTRIFLRWMEVDTTSQANSLMKKMRTAVEDNACPPSRRMLGRFAPGTRRASW
jgi:hypothetical protein